MSKSAKVWVVVASLLLAIGVVVFIVAGCIAGWDFSKFGTGNYITNTHQVNEEFTSISVKTSTANVVFVPSDNEKCTVVCYEHEKIKNSVSVVDGVLTVNEVDERKWFEHISLFNFNSSKITVHLPKTAYTVLNVKSTTGDINIPNQFQFSEIKVSVTTGAVDCSATTTGTTKITATTGDIFVKNSSVAALDLSVSTGKVTVSNVTCAGEVKVEVSTGKTFLTNVSCKNLITSGNTGDISLNNVIATEKFRIERSTGDVHFTNCDAAEIFVETDTGDVSGTLRSGKSFVVDTDTGKVRVPSGSTGGRCEINTDTGDIEIAISGV